MEDIAPSLLEKIKNDFKKAYTNDSTIQNLLKNVDKSSNYSVANEFAIRVGELFAQSFKRNLSSDVLPNGKMYYNIAKTILNDTLRENHTIVTDFTKVIQLNINEKLKIGINYINPLVDQERIDGFINRIANEDIFDEIAWILDEPIVNYSQSVVDDVIKANADFHSKAGLKPMIVRRMAGNCCDWCKQQAGTYIYPNVPRDVYRRHQRCRCTVEYISNGNVKALPGARK